MTRSRWEYTPPHAYMVDEVAEVLEASGLPAAHARMHALCLRLNSEGRRWLVKQCGAVFAGDSMDPAPRSKGTEYMHDLAARCLRLHASHGRRHALRVFQLSTLWMAKADYNWVANTIRKGLHLPIKSHRAIRAEQRRLPPPPIELLFCSTTTPRGSCQTPT